MTHSTYQQPLPQNRLNEAAMPYHSDGQAVPGGPHIYPEMAAAGLWTTPSDLARVRTGGSESTRRQVQRGAFDGDGAGDAHAGQEQVGAWSRNWGDRCASRTSLTVEPMKGFSAILWHTTRATVR